MIRDPSDGTVRDPTCKESLQVQSGLPITKEKPGEIERLEKSHEWLKQYFTPL